MKSQSLVEKARLQSGLTNVARPKKGTNIYVPLLSFIGGHSLCFREVNQKSVNFWDIIATLYILAIAFIYLR
jgi:hypothetical protein